MWFCVATIDRISFLIAQRSSKSFHKTAHCFTISTRFKGWNESQPQDSKLSVIADAPTGLDIISEAMSSFSSERSKFEGMGDSVLQLIKSFTEQ